MTTSPRSLLNSSSLLDRIIIKISDNSRKMRENAPDSELQVSWYDTMFLVITCGITSQFEDLSGQVFEHGSEVH